MKLIVRNIARETTELELLTLFRSFGQVVDFTLVMDEKTGQSKGFGFVEMTYNDEANAAMKELDGEIFQGSKLRVKKSSRGTRKKFNEESSED